MKTHKDIQGWFDFHLLYFEQARSYASAHFVEVGAWLGKSACFMGEQIRKMGHDIRFDVVDTWQGAEGEANRLVGPEEAGDDLYERFLQNVADCELSDIINPVRLPSVEAAKLYEDASLDFVFIDGDHREEAIAADIAAWWPKIRPGGVLAGHDYDEPGPQKAANDFAGQNDIPLWQDNTKTWVMRKCCLRGANVFLALPYHGSISGGTSIAAWHTATAHHKVTVKPSQSSLLAANFNKLWVEALQSGFTHFAMLHSDIEPQRWWLDLLLEDMHDTGVDLLGAVAPIKDARGLTSLGIAQSDAANCWAPLRRFTVREACGLPSTFTAADAGYPGCPLLLNTGCWLADLRNPNWRATDEHGNHLVYFTINDRVWVEENQIKAAVQSEDWFFSRRAHDAGLNMAATRKVNLRHWGPFSYPNYAPWGTWEDDEETRCLWAERVEEEQTEKEPAAIPAA